MGAVAREPSSVCSDAQPAVGCSVTPSESARSIYCSCRCDVPDGGDRPSLCTCPGDYVCARLESGDSYCLKPDYAQ